MNGAVCPYCRMVVDTESGEQWFCSGCGTPHHKDCYDENGGCTVFGCRCAPPEEPKVAISAPELVAVNAAGPAAPPMVMAAPTFAGYAPPVAQGAAAAASPALIDSAITRVPEPEPKNKMTFILLGVFLGALGGHNFYAGYYGKAIGQICLSVLTLGFGSPMAWIWAVIEICTVSCDSKGVQFQS